MSEPFHPNSAGAALTSDDIAHTFAEQLGVEYPDRYGDRVYDTGNITITNRPRAGHHLCRQARPHDPGTRPGASGDPSGHADAAAVDPVRARERTSDRPTFDHPARARRPPLVPFQPPTPPSLIPPLGGGGLRRTPSQPPPPPEGSPGSDRRQERPRVDPVRPVARGAADVVLPAPRAASLRNPGRRSCPPARDCCDAATGRSQAPCCLSRRLCRRLLERFLCMSTL